MKTIIVGTDFTPSSVNACKYAALLAEKLNCRLTLFNMFNAPIIHTNMGLYGLSYASVKQNSQAKVNKIMGQLQKLFPKVEMAMFVSNGSFKEELENFVSSHKVEAAVMGLEAKHRFTKFIYGSHGVNVAGKIDAPVIIVPEKYRKHRLSKVLLAVDNSEKLRKSSLRRFEKFLDDSKAKLRLLHVRTEEEVLAPAVVSASIGGKKMPIEVINGKDIQGGVKSYCRTANFDLIAVVSKKHSVFYDLFAESNTKKIAFAANVPVLAVHE